MQSLPRNWQTLGRSRARLFFGGLIVTFLVLAIAGRETALHTLLLAGLAANAVSLALVGLIGVLVVDESSRSIAFWTLGSLNHATWQEVVVASLMLPLAWRLVYRAEALNAMVLSEHAFFRWVTRHK